MDQIPNREIDSIVELIVIDSHEMVSTQVQVLVEQIMDGTLGKALIETSRHHIFMEYRVNTMFVDGKCVATDGGVVTVMIGPNVDLMERQ